MLQLRRAKLSSQDRIRSGFLLERTVLDSHLLSSRTQWFHLRLWNQIVELEERGWVSSYEQVELFRIIEEKEVSDDLKEMDLLNLTKSRNGTFGMVLRVA